jgi:hypothetical protein
VAFQGTFPRSTTVEQRLEQIGGRQMDLVTMEIGGVLVRAGAAARRDWLCRIPGMRLLGRLSSIAVWQFILGGRELSSGVFPTANTP